MTDTKKQPLHPAHPNQLVGSKWSSVDDALDYTHWEVMQFRKSTGDVMLRASLDKLIEITLPWRALRDRCLWTPGWV